MAGRAVVTAEVEAGRLHVRQDVVRDRDASIGAAAGVRRDGDVGALEDVLIDDDSLDAAPQLERIHAGAGRRRAEGQPAEHEVGAVDVDDVAARAGIGQDRAIGGRGGLRAQRDRSRQRTRSRDRARPGIDPGREDDRVARSGGVDDAAPRASRVDGSVAPSALIATRAAGAEMSRATERNLIASRPSCTLLAML